MQCKKPIESRREDGTPFSYRCDQCIGCRVTKAQEWAFRILLEAKFTADVSLFVTLTYTDKYLPRTECGRPTTRIKDLNLFVRKLRQNTGWKVRYFGPSEYGDQLGRPHLHCACFIDFDGNMPKYWEPKGENKKHLNENRIRWSQYGAVEREILRAWGCKGSIQAKELTEDHAQYLSKYLCKGALKAKQLHPAQEEEQFSMSPGIGRAGAPWIAENIRKVGGTLIEIKEPGKAFLCSSSTYNWLRGDIPSNRNVGMRTSKKTFPVSKYLREKVIDALGGDQRTEQEKRKEQRFQRDLQKVDHFTKREQRNEKAERQIRRKLAERGKL